MMLSTKAKPILFTTALVVTLISLYLLIGGGWLLALGGSTCYLTAGIVLLAVAVLLIRSRQEALWLYAALLIGTVVWELREVGLDFWALLPRGDVLVCLGIWLVPPFVTRGLTPPGRAASAALGTAIILALAIMGIALTSDPHSIGGYVPPAAGSPATDAEAGADWTAYGGTGFGDRFSALAQITPANVRNLKPVWQFETGDNRKQGESVLFTNEATPLKVGDLLYTCSPHQIVFALDAATGKLRWKFDPRIVSLPHLGWRGVAYHRTAAGAQGADGQPAPSDCLGRIFLATNDGMFALDAETGKPCDRFGDHGEIDLRPGSEVQTIGFYAGTSPPVVPTRF
jgi:quinoprotein glucose dehydrogenase